jgi:hypothetical protein
MAVVFLSHSSRDKRFVRKLAADLRDMGHEPWLDEWSLKVGECIVAGVEHAISDADFVVLVLSPNAVESGWVDREWKAKYWSEVEARRNFVLPVLHRDCKIPTLLKTRKYADFRKAYATGLVDLAKGIGASPTRPVTNAVRPNQLPQADERVTSLLSRVLSRQTPLSSCLAESLSLAPQLNASALLMFAQREIGGYEALEITPEDTEFPTYRLVQTFYSFTAVLNLSFFGWGGNANSAIPYMAARPREFSQTKTFMTQPLSEIERMAAAATPTAILHWTRRLDQLVTTATDPAGQALGNFYARGDAQADILEGVRSTLSKHLIALLPGDANAKTVKKRVRAK